MSEFTQADRDQAIDMARQMGKSYAFPEVQLFGELFESIEPFEGNAKTLETFPGYDAKDERCRIQDYCAVEHGEALRVKPTKAVRDYLKQRFGVPGSIISFQVVFRGDGSALVSARVSHIIASAWLAIVHESSVREPKALGSELFTDPEKG